MSTQPQTENEPKSKLVASIEARAPKFAQVSTAQFLIDSLDLGTIRIRPAKVNELNLALTRANDYVSKMAEKSKTAIDPEVLTNAKVAFLLQLTCFEGESTTKLAFPSPQWLLNNLNSKEMAVLYNAYIEAVRTISPSLPQFTEDQLETLADLCVTYQMTDAPNLAFANYEREQLADLVVHYAVKYRSTQQLLAEAKEPVQE